MAGQPLEGMLLGVAQTPMPTPDAMPDAMARENAIAEFAVRFPIDEPAQAKLRALPDHTFQRVVARFRPEPDSNPDFSRRLMGFLKKFEGPRSSAVPAVAFNPAMSRPMESRHAADRPDMGRMEAPLVTDEELELFRLRFPMDDNAWDYLKNIAPSVQERVVNTFRPPDSATDQGDYSKIVTSYITFCSRRQRAEPAPAAPAGRPRVSLEQARAALLGAGDGFGRREVPSESLETFRLKYPMDDRAFDFLSSAPQDVQERVVATFKIDRSQDDYSRAVTAHVRFCMRRHRESSDGFVELPGGSEGEQTLARIADFKAMFPIDDRALDYLLQSSCEVKRRVLSEFRPQHSPDGDYSRSLTAYIRRCRDDERAAPPPPSFSRAPPPRRRSRSPAYAPRRSAASAALGAAIPSFSGLSSSQQAQAAELLANALQMAGGGSSGRRPRVSSHSDTGGGGARGPRPFMVRPLQYR